MRDLPGYGYAGREELPRVLAVAQLEAEAVGDGELVDTPARPAV